MPGWHLRNRRTAPRPSSRTFISGRRRSSSLEEIAAGVERMQDNLDEQRVESVLDASAAGGRGVCGMSPTLVALGTGAVNEVLLSVRLANSSPMDAERVGGEALRSGVRVTCVSGRGAGLLDRQAGGVAGGRWFASPVSGAASSDFASAERDV